MNAKEGARGGTMGSPTLNRCRCTGYHNIVRAVQAAAEAGR
jgi:aerobic-type carbon monoxide dehydrogenase small subunit (CoxS/CutS family)